MNIRDPQVRDASVFSAVGMVRFFQQETKRRTVKVRILSHEAALKRLVTAILVEIDERWATSDKPYITWKAEDD